ncbi:MAG: hypothetical protein JWR19_2014 [Pedosphaera sp.]|nr:hypothetical protein [Pedosphaera sp.]
MNIVSGSQTLRCFSGLCWRSFIANIGFMTTSKTILQIKMLAVAALVLGLSQFAHAAELTAFQLIKEGNRHVGEDAKDKVVQLRSEKSVGSLVPNIWYVVFYDPDATFKATEVKFGAGKKLEVKRPTRLLEPISGDDKKLDRKKMNVDSDKALESAMADPLLTNLKVVASQMWLERSDDGPRWKVRLWALKLRNPEKDADIGDMYISADDGKVLRRDLHINKVD